MGRPAERGHFQIISLPEIDRKKQEHLYSQVLLVRLKGFEPPTFWFVAKHSIQLSYSRIPSFGVVPADSSIILPHIS